MSEGIMNVFFDIETIPGQPEEQHRAIIANSIQAPAQMKKVDTISDWHNGEGKYAGEKEKAIESEYRRQSFDGSKGEIISLAFAVEDGDIFSFHRGLDESESILLTKFYGYLDDILKGRPPFFIGHRVAGFDMRFLFHRSVILGVRPPFDINFSGRHGKDYFDNMIAWAGYKDTISQDNLAKALGLKGKPDSIDGSKVWDFAKEGRIEEIAEYNRDDVDQVRQIFNRITFR